MMKVFILVIMLTQYRGGVSIESIEIGSLKQCQIASSVIHKATPKNLHLGGIKTACIESGGPL